MTGRTATREERERGRECRGQRTKNDGKVTVAGSAGYDHSSGKRDHSYNAHKIVGVGSGMGMAVHQLVVVLIYGISNIHLAAGEDKVGDN